MTIDNEEIAAPDPAMTEFETAMQQERAVQARFGRFEDWTPEEVAYLIEALANGMAKDVRRRFDGYKGASLALRIASAFVEQGDKPETNGAALAYFGLLVQYALNSTYWGNSATPARPNDCDMECTALVAALTAIYGAAYPIAMKVSLTGSALE
jgi:hypothetical protein